MSKKKPRKQWEKAVVSASISISILLVGCKQIEYVPIESTHTIEHHHTDSVRQVDSIFKNKETIIMQLDSEEMAKYGITLQAAERAWLVKTAELERYLQRLASVKTDTVVERDSIPVPYPVVKIETKHHWGGWVAFGGVLLSVVIGIIVALFIRKGGKNGV